MTAKATLDALRELFPSPVSVEALRRHRESIQQLLYPPAAPKKAPAKKKSKAKVEGDDA